MSVLVKTATAFLLLVAGVALGSNWLVGTAIVLYLVLAVDQCSVAFRERGQR